VKNRRLAWEVYNRTKDFGGKPHQHWVFDDEVNDLALFYFDRGVWYFGRRVDAELAEAGSHKNTAIANSNRMRALARCMGDDMSTSTVGFRDPAYEPTSEHGREAGEDETILRSGY